MSQEYTVEQIERVADDLEDLVGVVRAATAVEMLRAFATLRQDARVDVIGALDPLVRELETMNAPNVLLKQITLLGKFADASRKLISDAMQSKAALSAQPAPCDGAIIRHVGDSKFESWYVDYEPSEHGAKQRARDAYAAGLTEQAERFTAQPAPATRERLEDERWRLMNSFGQGAFADGKTRDRLAEIDAELAAQPAEPARIEVELEREVNFLLKRFDDVPPAWVTQHVEWMRKHYAVQPAERQGDAIGFVMNDTATGCKYGVLKDPDKVPDNAKLYLHPDAPVGVPDETGWLIEAWDSKRNELKAQWWSITHDGSRDEHWAWSSDSTRALRFARECDAQAYIEDMGWTEAKPTEHAWLAAAPSAPQGVNRG